MPRPLRPDLANTWYHVTNRGHNRKDIVRDESDCETLAALLGDATRETNIEIHSFVFMPNHLHLLIYAPDGQLSLAMKRVMGIYAQAFNAKYGQDGSLWKGRFYSLVVEKEAHLMELPRYIENNPVKAGLVDDPSRYRWSSYRSMVGIDPPPDFLTTNVVIPKWFGGDLRRYESFVQGRDSVAAHRLGQAIEGDARFVRLDDALNALDEPDNQQAIALMVEEFVCAETGASAAELHRTRRGHSNVARATAITIIARSGAATAAEIAKRFGLAGRSSVWSTVQRCERAAATDPDLARLLACGYDRFGEPAAS